MRFPNVAVLLSAVTAVSSTPVSDSGAQKRATSQIAQGEPIDGTGKGAPILGGTNHQLDLQNPDNLGAQSTDNGLVPNLKWSFSDSRTRIFNGGWTREQIVSDIPASTDIAGAQQHLKKGASRELHWHRVAEWGYLYSGSVLLSAVDEHGNYQVDKLEVGDIWYFPKGAAHTALRMRTNICSSLNGTVSTTNITGPESGLYGNSSYVFHHSQKEVIPVPGGGGNLSIIDSRNFPIAKTIAAAVISLEPGGLRELHWHPNAQEWLYFHKRHQVIPVPGGGGNLSIIDSRNFPIAKTIAAAVISLEPGGLRELHWHPNAQEWLYFHKGQAQATIFIGGANARTFDFTAGDTAVFPDNSGHYIENTGTENLVWIEIYKSDRVADISLTQWLALTPADIVANTLKLPISVVQQLKKEKQLLIKGS
ncbi:related to oxalate decarboxylase [Phialocephala subalpina]|uniref:Related to oxalate decarboxylase n=1 Tax=Phialocephala subalpina TaxID=576137 RepID=A0A1L7XU03_9HELO|nr:related to oxalate decarboxylase [Phialocephala subalpina]